jgi:Protein of unknown function (DUF1592)/Protein of unknown function (DUF1588)/Protein of unknown function (DUF1595)/Protein of unknown function (DUF1585)/Protein of unknown function (DUF1587)
MRKRGPTSRLLGGMAALVTVFALAACSKGPREPQAPAEPPHLRLMTTEQYLNTLGYIFGPSVTMEMKFAPLQRDNGLLANDAAVAGVTGAQLEQYQRAASVIAAQVVDESHRGYLIPCKPADEKAADKACATQFFTRVGRLLHRRSLKNAEVAAYVDKAADAATQLKDFYAGLNLTLESMLIEPEVLFVVEKAEPDPNNAGKMRLDAHSLASRLSFFLWNAAPDDDLLKVAENGSLQTKKGLEQQVNVMLASPRLETGIRAFFDDMFQFDAFDSLSKDPTVYPFYTGLIGTEAREQTLRTVVDQLIHKNADYRDLYTTRSTFISPSLAALYGIPASPGWQPYEFPADSPRQGLLTQVSFLATHAHPGRSSPTRRGKALREILLCQVVPNPPANVDFSALNNPKAQYPTQRDRVKVHLQNATCAGCHRITDPTGLALENFDGAGRFRTEENGHPIDASGDLDGKKFADVTGLGRTLHDNPGLPNCLVNRVFSYGTGAAVPAKYREVLQYFDTRFSESGYKVPELLRTIALSRTFQEVRAPSKGAAPAPQAQTTASDDSRRGPALLATR